MDRPGRSATTRISPLTASPTWSVGGLPRMNIATTRSLAHAWYPTGSAVAKIGPSGSPERS